MSRPFRERVLSVVRGIRPGRTMTYGAVARAAGAPHAARAVGAILKNNYNPAIPCHRVIRADGSLGGYNRGAVRKRALLAAEAAVPPTPDAHR